LYFAVSVIFKRSFFITSRKTLWISAYVAVSC
jgi:hypothetical protein